MTSIERGFVRIEEGQVHFRTNRPMPPGGVFSASGEERPIWMVHASPASSISLVPLLHAFAPTRRAIAPDTLGNGDSAPASPQVPDIAYYARSSLKVMDALGIAEVDLYGSHTGAHIAVEMALQQPARIRRIVLDGIALFTPEQKRRYGAEYAPAMSPDFFGSQIHWAWHFVRDQAWYFPYFERNPAHLRAVPPPSPEVLHRTVVEVLKAIGTYHHAYRAAFAHPDRERLPLLTQRTLAMADVEDPLKAGLDEAASLLRDGGKLLFEAPAGADPARAKADLLSRFFVNGAVS